MNCFFFWENATTWQKNKNKEDAATLLHRRNELLLLLGECNYMAKECARLAKEKKKKRR